MAQRTAVPPARKESPNLEKPGKKLDLPRRRRSSSFVPARRNAPTRSPRPVTAPASGATTGPTGERREQNDGTGTREREATDDAGAEAPAPEHCDSGTGRGGRGDPGDCAWQGDPPDGEPVSTKKMQPDAEDQQHHADLGELLRQFEVGDEAGCRRPDEHAANQPSDQGREFQTRHNQAGNQGKPEGSGKGW